MYNTIKSYIFEINLKYNTFLLYLAIIFVTKEVKMAKIETRVLLCEDESDAREILSFYLNTIFDEVVSAKDGLAGLEAYKNDRNFDLVLTDIKMPNMDGISMLEAIHKLSPKQKFIIVSAYKDEEKLLKSIELKVLGYFVKPLNVDNVMEMLKKAKEEVLKDKVEALKDIDINKTYTYKPKEKLLYSGQSLIKLSKKELLVLELLIEKKGNIVTTEEFKQRVWEDKDTLDTTFRTVMKRLKDKIKDDDFILSRKGQGYIVE